MDTYAFMTTKLIKYALNADKKLMFIDNVPNGMECGCVCPGCKEKLKTKMMVK